MSTIPDLYSFNKKYTIFIIGAIVIFFIAFTIINKKETSTKADDKKVNAIMDSLEVWKSLQQATQHEEEVKYKRDSIRLANIEYYTSRLPEIMQSINNKYNAQKHIINNLSPDQQFKLFTNWISQADSL